MARQGQFQPGRAKTGGRKTGVLNKKTREQCDRIDQFFQTHWDEFDSIWAELTPKEKKDTFIAMMNYRYPKLQSVDVRDTTERNDSALDVLRNAVGDSDII